MSLLRWHLGKGFLQWVMALLKVLIVDDDELVRESFRMCVPDHWEVIEMSGPGAPPATNIHAAFVDMHLSGNLEKSEGIEYIRKLLQQHPQLEVVAMSGDLNRELMEKSLKAGASRFIAKPLSREEVQLLLEKIAALWQLRGVGGPQSSRHMEWIGEGTKSEEVKRFVAGIKGERSPILIQGESGTGKEVISRLIHQQDTSRPFVAVNVAAIPENLFESEFFGHMKGAFTGAIQNRMGFAEQAHGGDLFLDEVEALPKVHQAKLLRFLENGEFHRVGGKDVIRADVRIIAASNEDLNHMVRENQFREDLLFRLAGHKLDLPPLRDRTEDIETLAQYFIKLQKPFLKKEFSGEAMAVLRSYGWPGNVRELKRVCERLCVSSPLPVIRDSDVKKLLFDGHSSSLEQDIDFAQGLSSLLAHYEKSILSSAIDKVDDVDELSRLLKISRSSFYKKVKDHGLELKG